MHIENENAQRRMKEHCHLTIYLIYDCNYSLPLDILCPHILIRCNVVLPPLLQVLLVNLLYLNMPFSTAVLDEISELFVSH